MTVDQIFDEVTDTVPLLQSLLSASNDCIKILDLDGHLVFMTEAGQRVMEIPDFSAVKGCPWPDFWPGRRNYDAKAALDEARAGRIGHFQGFAPTMKGTPRWWDVTVTLVRGAAGKPDKLLSVSRDITDTHLADRALRESQQRLTAALAAADIGTWDFNPQTGVLNWDDRCYELFGLTPGRPISFPVFLDGVHPLDREATEKACIDAMQFDGPQAYDIEFRTVGFEDGVERWCSAKGKAFFEDGIVARFIGTIRYIGKLKRAEQRQQLLTHELEHRLKNTMAMVGAIANQTFRAAATKEEARDVFDARLFALNRAHDILTRSSWTRASMPAVVQGALAPHQTADGRIHIIGPAVDLTAKQAMSLALALHELATNAAKYGALSGPAGTIDVRWDCRPSSDGAAVLVFRWQEQDGPPVSPPARKGFGSRLIESTLSTDFGRTVNMDFVESGLVCSFECPLDDLAGEPE